MNEPSINPAFWCTKLVTQRKQWWLNLRKKKKKKILALLANLQIALPQGTERHNTTLTGCASGNFVTTFARDHGVRIWLYIPCAHFGHACSMTPLQAELMQKTNGKENCHGSCGWGSSNLTLLDCLQKLTRSTPIDSFLHSHSATILHQMTRSHSHIVHTNTKDALYEAGLLECSLKAPASIF